MTRYKPGNCPVEAVFYNHAIPCLLGGGHKGAHQYVPAEEPGEPEPRDYDPGSEPGD